MTTDTLLNERGKTHGDFSDNSHFAQTLRALWRQSAHWPLMPPEHREALDQMAGKLSRILSGQSLFADHFLDISGYALLAVKACERACKR